MVLQAEEQRDHSASEFTEESPYDNMIRKWPFTSQEESSHQVANWSAPSSWTSQFLEW